MLSAMMRARTCAELKDLLQALEQFVFVAFFIQRNRQHYREADFTNLAHECFLEDCTVEYCTTQILNDLQAGERTRFDKFKAYISDLYAENGRGFKAWDGLKYFLSQYRPIANIPQVAAQDLPANVRVIMGDQLNDHDKQFIRYSLGNCSVGLPNGQLPYNQFRELGVELRRGQRPIDVLASGLHMLQFLQRNWRFNFGVDTRDLLLLLFNPKGNLQPIDDVGEIDPPGPETEEDEDGGYVVQEERPQDQEGAIRRFADKLITHYPDRKLKFERACFQSVVIRQYTQAYQVRCDITQDRTQVQCSVAKLETYEQEFRTTVNSKLGPNFMYADQMIQFVFVPSTHLLSGRSSIFLPIGLDNIEDVVNKSVGFLEQVMQRWGN
jgi:hypothetical protein